MLAQAAASCYPALLEARDEVKLNLSFSEKEQNWPLHKLFSPSSPLPHPTNNNQLCGVKIKVPRVEWGNDRVA